MVYEYITDVGPEKTESIVVPKKQGLQNGTIIIMPLVSVS